MAFGKWIGGFLGWSAFGPIGALIGFAVGAMWDKAVDGASSIGDEPLLGGGGQSGYGGATYYGGSRQQEGDRNSFLLSMLVLAAYIIKADGRVMHSEMEVVRGVLRQNFGETGAQEGEKILRRIFDEEKRIGSQAFRENIRQSCQQVAANVDYSGRLQLLSFLVMIAQADGSVPQSEITALKEVATWMLLSAQELDSMLHLKGETLDDAYKVLGLTPQATDDDVKKAYRRLALEHHPDRVAKLGEDVRRAAEKKFQEINAAKERIFKARGL